MEYTHTFAITGIEMQNAVTVMVLWILGISIGSFLNVCIFRIPAGKSVVFPPSSCRWCGHRLRWWENIPLASYFILRGRCRVCQAPYSVQYPVVEFLGGIVVVANYAWFGGINAAMILYSILGFTLILLSWIDWRHYWIPDKVVAFGMLFGIAGIILSNDFGWLRSFMGGVAGGISMAGLGLLGYALYRKESLGGGDVKLMIMVGIYLGWKLTLLSIFLGAVAAFFAYGLLLISNRGNRNRLIPFGSFLSIGTMASLWFGDALLEWHAHAAQRFLL